MILLNIFETTLPLTNPVLKFLVILIIILSAPILSNKLKMPHILGLIIAGAVIGPNGLTFVARQQYNIIRHSRVVVYYVSRRLGDRFGRIQKE